MWRLSRLTIGLLSALLIRVDGHELPQDAAAILREEYQLFAERFSSAQVPAVERERNCAGELLSFLRKGVVWDLHTAPVDLWDHYLMVTEHWVVLAGVSQIDDLALAARLAERRERIKDADGRLGALHSLYRSIWELCGARVLELTIGSTPVERRPEAIVELVRFGDRYVPVPAKALEQQATMYFDTANQTVLWDSLDAGVRKDTLLFIGHLLDEGRIGYVRPAVHQAIRSSDEDVGSYALSWASHFGVAADSEAVMAAVFAAAEDVDVPLARRLRAYADLAVTMAEQGPVFTHANSEPVEQLIDRVAVVREYVDSIQGMEARAGIRELFFAEAGLTTSLRRLLADREWTADISDRLLAICEQGLVAARRLYHRLDSVAEVPDNSLFIDQLQGLDDYLDPYRSGGERAEPDRVDGAPGGE